MAPAAAISSARLALSCPSTRGGRHPALRLGAEPVQGFLVLETLQAFEERCCGGFTERPARQAEEFIVEFALFEHPVLGMAFEAAPIGERDRDRARHPAMLSARLRHQRDAAGGGPGPW